MGKTYFVVAKFGKVHGIKGLIKLYSTTDFPELYLKKLNFYIKKEGKFLPVEFLSIKKYKGEVYLVNIKDYSFEDVRRLVGFEIFLPAEMRAVPSENSFYVEDMGGMVVLDESGKKIGIVLKAEQGLTNDMLNIKLEDGKEILFPFLKRWIEKVDFENKIIKIKSENGLI